jgi:hypothetical protein
MTGTSHLTDLGKMVEEESKSGPGMSFYRTGKLRGCHMWRGPWWMVVRGALGWRNFPVS